MTTPTGAIFKPEFEALLLTILDITARCDRDQLMELADRLHQRRRALARHAGELEEGLYFH